MFEIKKRTKLGDPLSSLLFDIVLQEALKDDLSTLAKETRNGHMLRRLGVRLPHKFALC